ncbi:MAG: leucine-rich repeat protein, partial [Oscillospiraceae bacterium]|nr:leucine-rich repeat protein [Oscillospiraceae bacterium]
MSEACKELKRNCFMGCTALTEFKLPDTVETIGDNAFMYSGLAEIKLSKNLKALGKSCFEQARLKSVTLPEGLTEIGPRCFMGTMIENIVIPESVRSIGDECFNMCNNLCTAVFPDTDIRLGQKLFWMCSALRSVHLPEPLLRIPDGLFYRCSMLKEVNIPASCIAIEAEAFFACEALETVTIPRRCREIGDFCFKGCMWLEEIELPEVCTTLGAHCFEGCSRLKSLRIPDSITALGEGMLTNCSELTELTLSNSLTEFSFTDIIGTEKLKKLVIPESVQKITYALGSDTPAMSNRFGLTDLTLPKRKDLEIKPFSIPFSVLNSSKEPIVYGDSILYYWCGDSREITVPDGIKSIGMYAFEKNGVDILTIPPSVQKIDPNALVHTYSVRKIRGACLSAAHAFAVEHEIEFEPTEDASEPQGAPIPHYDSSNLPFGNNGGIFGDTYDISNWQRSLLFSFAPSRSRMEKKMAEEWQGSCYGLSAVTILVRAGLLPLAALDPEAKTLSDVRPTKQAIQLINYYQMSADIVSSRLDVGSEYSSVKILNALRFAEEANQGGLPFLISFSSPGGDHAVVGYGLEAGSWTFGGKEYDRRIPIWDSNYAEPNDSAALYISSIDLTYTIPAYNLVYEDIFSEHKLIFVIGTPASLNIAPYREPALAAGDLNGSGEPDVSDAMEALRAYTNNMAGFLDELTVDQKYAADVNGDTLLTVEDAQLILKFYTQSTVAGKAVTWESLLAQ